MLLFILVVLVILVAAFTYRRLTKVDILPLSFRPPEACPVSYNPNNMRRCTVDDDCKACLNSVCQEVPAGAGYTPTDSEVTKLPLGRFCLPQKINTMKCNRYTADPVLTKDPVSKKFYWRCQCKDPAMISNQGVKGDCVHVKACTPGSLVCPPDASQDPSIGCTPGKVWDGTWDPKYGICSCPRGLTYVRTDNQKLCVRDKCYPGKGSRTGCDCSGAKSRDKYGNWTSYISNKTGDACIPDTCNPLGYSDGGRCVCNKGSVPVIRPDRKMVCVSPCGDGTPATNPCIRRGTCVVQPNGKYRYKCIRCRFPYYQDGTTLCKNLVKPAGAFCDHNYECENKRCSYQRDSTTSMWKYVVGKPVYAKCREPGGRGFGGL